MDSLLGFSKICCVDVVYCLGAFVVDTTYSSTQTGAPRLSGHDATDKMDLLVSKHKKDSRWFDALQELKDYLLDDTAWPVVMQWFNKDH